MKMLHLEQKVCFPIHTIERYEFDRNFIFHLHCLNFIFTFDSCLDACHAKNTSYFRLTQSLLTPWKTSH